LKSKFITDQNEWIECLSLKYPWGKKLSPVICSTEALGEISDKVETGYFIAKQKFIIHSIPLCKKQTEFKSRIIREKRVMSMDYLICRSEVWQDNEILVQLESTLVRNGVQKIKEQKNLLKLLELVRSMLSVNYQEIRITFTREINLWYKLCFFFCCWKITWQ
jgi:hypothetical protein